ncbi:Hsp70 family protein [bacterium]|nr:Hsp70 family protein [bacterium]
MSVDNAHRPVLGIDLGTTFSCIARWDGKGPSVYPLAGGKRTLPSVVYYDEKNKDYLVGDIAVKWGLINPENAVFGVKRMMDNKNEQIKLGDQTFSPVDISQKILEKLMTDVRNKFPEGVFKPEGVVVTVPYYFKAHQCRNTEEAAQNANINVLGILQEPIAAALAYMMQLEHDNQLANRSETFLVFDLGGGTFDITVFELTITDDLIRFEVLSTGGDDRLGGLDFDNVIKDHIVKEQNLGDDFVIPDNLGEDDNKKKTTEVKKAVQSLLEAGKIAKEELSAMDTAFIAIPHVFPGKNVDMELSLDKMNELLDPYVKKIRDIIDATIARSGKRADEVSIVIKVGGSSQLKVMHQLLSDFFGESKVYGDVNPCECVAQGASIYAAIQDGRLEIGKEIEIQTRTSHALGVEVEDGIFHEIIPANSEAPCDGWEIFGTDGDNVTELEIDVYQGSSAFVKDNSKVGTVHVSGLLQRPAGELDIKVTFKVSDQQIVSVIVEEEESGIKKVEKMQVA